MNAHSPHAFALMLLQVLCASNDTHDAVDPVIAPEGVPNGEKITFEGFTGEAMAEVGLTAYSCDLLHTVCNTRYRQDQPHALTHDYARVMCPQVNPKKKILERLLPDMKTDASE